jgi:hypothetical protein
VNIHDFQGKMAIRTLFPHAFQRFRASHPADAPPPRLPDVQ